MDLINNNDNLKKELENNSIVLTVSSGNSMYPFIKNNTKIVISKSDHVDILDTVLYKRNNNYVLHRIIAMNDKDYIVLGDNCLKSEVISKKSVIGLLVAYYRNNNYIEINDKLNIKYFNISKINKPFIKIKYFIKKLLK